MHWCIYDMVSIDGVAWTQIPKSKDGCYVLYILVQYIVYIYVLSALV